MSKNAIIFGDSYSTFEGYIPEGYESWYYKNGHADTDVTRVEETWWYPLLAQADLKLLLNNSWSGSTISFTGYDGVDCSRTSSFLYRLRQLIVDGFFEKNRIDTAFVFGGTNDFWANSALGNAKYDDFQDADLYYVLPAIGCFLKTLRQQLPEAEIYCLVSTELNSKIVDYFYEACARFGITAVTIEFEKLDKLGGHPTIAGMNYIRQAVLRALSTHEAAKGAAPCRN